ncbi:hypothetical protein MHK_004141 [Candidatus Magnetomorum sp. HK-1]|nr:hypothetical protein MHK_004141 [Candidatus Magnetomorum sp. HK-1]
MVINMTNKNDTSKKNQLPLISLPEDLWDLEEKHKRIAAKLADQMTLESINQVHNTDEFVKEAVKKAREKNPHPLINKGCRPVTIILLGGTKVTISTPYLRIDWKKTTGRKHKKRGKKGSGMYPVLEAIGIKDRVTPATRSEISLHTVQSASYKEAIEMLGRHGLSINVTTLKRIAISTVQEDTLLRDAALSVAMDIPILADTPLAGKRVRLLVDGGRVRTRIKKKGRKSKKNRHKFKTKWREPRIIVVDILSEDGTYDSIRLPLYDVLIEDADTVFNLIIGYMRLLGAKYAETVEFISDGADWIWDRVDRLITNAEIPESKLFKVLDYYHACEHINEALDLCGNLSPKKRKKTFKSLKEKLKNNIDGVSEVIKELRRMASKDKSDEMEKDLKYFIDHVDHMQYGLFLKNKISIGSGAVESAVRRVINLRFKGNGSLWKKEVVEGLMHLRSFF